MRWSVTLESKMWFLNIQSTRVCSSCRGWPSFWIRWKLERIVLFKKEFTLSHASRWFLKLYYLTLTCFVAALQSHVKHAYWSRILFPFSFVIFSSSLFFPRLPSIVLQTSWPPAFFFVKGYDYSSTALSSSWHDKTCATQSHEILSTMAPIRSITAHADA